MVDRFAALIGVIRTPTHDEDAKWEAIASALESLHPPAPTESGEAPDPLPEVLPVGTRTVDGAVATTELEYGRRRTDYGGILKWETGYWGRWSTQPGRDLYNLPDAIDWAHYRRTSPQPREPEREAKVGEWLPRYSLGDGRVLLLKRWWQEGVGSGSRRWSEGATDADLAAVLKAMPEERRTALLREFYYDLYSVFQERLTKAVKRAEAAEERAAQAERERDEAMAQLEVAESSMSDAIERNDLSSKACIEARARVAELERWVPVLGMLLAFRERGSIVSDGLELYNPIDTVTGLRADACTPQQMAEYTTWFARLRKRREPTPTASPVDGGPNTESAARAEYGDDQKESPPRDSGGEVPAPLLEEVLGPLPPDDGAPTTDALTPGYLAALSSEEVATPGLTTEDARQLAALALAHVIATVPGHLINNMPTRNSAWLQAAVTFARSEGSKSSAYEAFFREHRDIVIVALDGLRLRALDPTRATAALKQLEVLAAELEGTK